MELQPFFQLRLVIRCYLLRRRGQTLTRHMIVGSVPAASTSRYRMVGVFLWRALSAFGGSDGTSTLRVKGADGSYLEATISVPVSLAAAPQIRAHDISAWYAPKSILLNPVKNTEQDKKVRFLLLLYFGFCRSEAIKALGASVKPLTGSVVVFFFGWPRCGQPFH